MIIRTAGYQVLGTRTSGNQDIRHSDKLMP